MLSVFSFFVSRVMLWLLTFFRGSPFICYSRSIFFKMNRFFFSTFAGLTAFYCWIHAWLSVILILTVHNCSRYAKILTEQGWIHNGVVGGCNPPKIFKKKYQKFRIFSMHVFSGLVVLLWILITDSIGTVEVSWPGNKLLVSLLTIIHLFCCKISALWSLGQLKD